MSVTRKPDFAVTVYGTPAPAGSKRAFNWRAKDGRSGTSIVDANAKAKPWKKEIAQAAGDLRNGAPVLEGPLAARFTFFAKRPKGHYGTGKNSGTLKASAPAYPIGKPDALKLTRGVEDALSGVVYRDDGQIVTEVLKKRYGTPERVEVEIWLL